MRGGLLRVAEVIDTDGAGGVLLNGITYEAHLCGKNRTIPVAGGALAAPVLSAGSTNATGGTFTAGTYYWKLTAVTGYGETTGSNEISATLVLNGSKVLTWATVSGAERYKLYRGTAAGAENVLVTTLDSGTLTYTDTGTSSGAATVPSSSTAGNTPPAAKTFDQQTILTGTPFGLYRGVEGAMLVSREDALREAQSAYDAGESYGVERAMQAGLLSPSAVDITPTPGTPVTNARIALGLLEQYAADNYSGLPVISGNRLAVGLLPELVVGSDYSLTTIHGTPVASSAGYTTDGPGVLVSGAQQAWLYISGKITIWRGPGGAYEAYDLKGNRVYALMERTYVPTVECFVAAILVG
jgi:hypothetical protein